MIVLIELIGKFCLAPVVKRYERNRLRRVRESLLVGLYQVWAGKSFQNMKLWIKVTQGGWFLTVKECVDYLGDN